MKAEKSVPYSTAYASLSLPLESGIPEISSVLMDASILVIIGIGWSNLGTLAVLDALHMGYTSEKALISLDTVDTYDIESSIDDLTMTLEAGEDIILCVISKSGSTAETIGIFELLYSELAVDYPGQVHIVTISDAGSKLDTLSKSEWWHSYNLPKNVGGRYSVLSDVWLFPLLWMGVDIDALRSGARQALTDLSEQTDRHPAAIVSSTLANGYAQWRNIFEHFFFAKNLENLGKWYRQLLAESIGKIGKNGKSVGITPTTSIGTTDLHSVAQLDLAHTGDRTLALVSLTWVSRLEVPEAPFPDLVEHIRGKSFSDIMEWARHGLIEALKTKDVSYFTYTLKSDDAYDLGYFLETKMLEVILLGHLFDVNPFDQPNVEDYKVGMKEYLGK
jgi:glucose-6-phosphate isomerase